MVLGEPGGFRRPVEGRTRERGAGRGQRGQGERGEGGGRDRAVGATYARAARPGPARPVAACPGAACPGVAGRVHTFAFGPRQPGGSSLRLCDHFLSVEVVARAGWTDRGFSGRNSRDAGPRPPGQKITGDSFPMWPCVTANRGNLARLREIRSPRAPTTEGRDGRRGHTLSEATAKRDGRAPRRSRAREIALSVGTAYRENRELTAGRFGIWHAQQLDPDNPVYNIGEYWKSPACACERG
jgi:hypothetical protein